ncbi:MlaD family protein [Flavobacterium algicola]|uniref:MlaD family protein n=1 Tax=Flavobacterium algicola TaxID=556529 RepID=UPI001EFD7BB7|nr:MlaD family protein [Flavobacterium algicola]MCG9792585.1 MlaD family protein [Flavobacterium algicola]
MKLTREIKTAILVIASILLFIWGYSFLKGRDLFSNYKTFYVMYDNVEGLAPSAPITLNGLVIGKLNGITISETTGKLVVELQVKTDFPISKSSSAIIYEPGFIGGKQIAIEPNLADSQLAEDGALLSGTVRKGLTQKLGDQLVPLQEKIEKLIVNADQLITGINNVLDTKAQADLKSSLADLSQTMKQFNKASASMNSILDQNKGQIKGIVTNFDKISGNFSKISDSINKANIAKTIRNLNATLGKVNTIISGMEAGQGTMGKLLKDDALYDNFNDTSKELELLLQDVRLHPTRYINVSVFGKKDKPYVAPTAKDTISNTDK